MEEDGGEGEDGSEDDGGVDGGLSPFPLPPPPWEMLGPGIIMFNLNSHHILTHGFHCYYYHFVKFLG